MANKNSSTPLHIAAAYGHQSVVEYLLRSGADLYLNLNPEAFLAYEKSVQYLIV